MENYEAHKGPMLQIGTPDRDIAIRIYNLDMSIREYPEAFMQVCRSVGGLALEYMPDQDSATQQDITVTTELTEKLSIFLDKRDLKHAAFDPDSTEMIYDHAGVMKLQRQARSNPEAITSGSVLQLYLYAKRAKEWQAQKMQKSELRNGAA